MTYLRILIITLSTCLFGITIDYLTNLETSIGLHSLFSIRGVREPPASVVIVALDEASELRLNVGKDLTRWRHFHAKLVEQLTAQGVLLIVFDVQFIVAHDDDTLLAAAIQAAGNVLLTECVQKLRYGVEDFFGREECSDSNQKPFAEKIAGANQVLPEQMVVMRKLQPTQSLAQAALDHAPFFLASSDSEQTTIYQAWTFFDALAEVPSLPVLTWLYYLQRSQGLAAQTVTMPISTWLTEQRRQCLDNPSQTVKTVIEINSRLQNVICQGDSRYLDFYGPAQTIKMVSYSDVYEGKVTDLKGKIVFVGKANRQFSAGKLDYFPVPFANAHSGNMSGVEILATQFANLLENRFVSAPLPHYIVLLLFAFCVTILLNMQGLALTLFCSLVYSSVSVWLFNRNSFWLPVAVPLIVQLPCAYMMTLMAVRMDLLNERKRILAFARRVFPEWVSLTHATPGQWRPEQRVAKATQLDVRGICLATDIAGYTTISSQHTPQQMWQLMNAYFRVLGQPVETYQGIITDVVGDAMMAVWFNLSEDQQRLAAALTALDIQLALDGFNQASTLSSLPTRIGINEGNMTLGRLDAGNSSYYSVIGDTVNIASRIEGVNKYLGTRILAAATIAPSLGSLIYRPVGVFRLVGRDSPVELIEIVGKKTAATAAIQPLYKQFALGLELFQQEQWQEAADCFQALLQQYDDGPSRFYWQKATILQKNPPRDWDKVITLENK